MDRRRNRRVDFNCRSGRDNRRYHINICEGCMNFHYPTDKDFEMVGKLYYFEHTKFYGASALDRYLIADSRIFPKWIKENACDAFATDDGHGICCLTPNPDGSKYIYSIYVDEAFRNRGYGQALIEHAKTIAPKGLTLHVNTQNPKALCLYHKCGFSVSAMEGKCDEGYFFWRIYMETKHGLKGREKDTIKYEFPTKEMLKGR